MPTGSSQSRRALRIGAAASVSRYRRSVGQAGSSPYPGRSIAIAGRLPRAAGYDAHMWRLESEPCTKTIGPVTVSAACDEECVSYMTGPARYGSRAAPVVSRLGTTLAARRSLEGDLKVVLSFPGFGGERAWNGFGHAMWLCAVRGAYCYHARAGLFVRPWTPACGSGSRPRGTAQIIKRLV